LTISALGQWQFTANGSAPSAKFRIVNELKACVDSATSSIQVCANKTDNTLDGADINTLVRAYGKITTSSSFFDTNLGTNVLLSTQFGKKADLTNMCGQGTKFVADPVDERITGTGITTATPPTSMLIVIPKNTLKASGVLSRGTPSFNVCLGTIYLPNPRGADATHPPAAPWTGKNAAGTGTAPAVPLYDTAAGLWRFWGTPGNCTAAGVSATNSGKDPCIKLRTKMKSDILAALGPDAAAQMNDSDLGIIVNKPYPWDGKGGVY